MSDNYQNEKEDWNVSKKKYKDYSKPNTNYVPQETMKDVKYLEAQDWEERGLTRETLDRFRVKCKINTGLGPESIEKVYFPYYNQTGKLTGYKVKDLTKDKAEKGHFYSIGHVGVDSQLFGQQQCRKSAKYLISCEGECFSDETQIFTDRGWKYFKDLDKTERVLQVDNNLNGSFVNPIGYIKKEFSGKLSSLKSRGFSSLTTPNHNIPTIDKKGAVRKQKACDIKSGYKIPKTIVVNGSGCGLNKNQIALQLAVSADSKIDVRKNGNLYAHFEFKKDRKKVRLEKILRELDISFTSYPQKRAEYLSFNLTLPSFIKGKDLPESWLIDMTHEERLFVLEEQVNWDGNRVPNRSQVEFSSSRYSQALWMHTMSHTAGLSGSIIRRVNDIGTWYKVSILFSNKSCGTNKNLKRSQIGYTGKVYCVTVPDGKILVKHKGHISVSGNCDALSVYQAIVENTDEKYKAYTPAVTSIGCGTVNAVEHMVNNSKFISEFPELRLCYDNDYLTEIDLKKKNPGMKGREATKAVGNHFMRMNVTTADWPDWVNDCSDYLQKGKSEELYKKVIWGCTEYNTEEIVGLYDMFKEGELFKPMTKGVYLNAFPKLMDKMLGVRPGELTLVMAPSGVGKSSIGADIAYSYAKEGNGGVGGIFLEEGMKKTCNRFIARDLEVHPNKYKWNPGDHRTYEQYLKSEKWVGDEANFLFLDHFGTIKISQLIDLAEILVYKHHREFIVLDHISLTISGNGDIDERVELEKAMTELAALCERSGAHIMVVSHINRMASSTAGKDREFTKPKWKRTFITDGKGTQALEALAWNIICIDVELLPDGTRGRIRLFLGKNREADELGFCDVVRMHPETGVFYDASEEVWIPETDGYGGDEE